MDEASPPPPTQDDSQATAPTADAQAPRRWAVLCPRHRVRADLTLRTDGLGPEVTECSVFPDGAPPMCDEACLRGLFPEDESAGGEG